MPMLLIIATAAMQSGITIVILKLITELGQAGEIFSSIGLVITLLVSMALSGVIQLHMLNLAMKYYDQIEAVPIYSTSVSIMWIITGLIVFDEIRFYEAPQLVGIFGGIILSCIGIKFLTMKNKIVD